MMLLYEVSNTIYKQFISKCTSFEILMINLKISLKINLKSVFGNTFQKPSGGLGPSPSGSAGVGKTIATTPPPHNPTTIPPQAWCAPEHK